MGDPGYEVGLCIIFQRGNTEGHWGRYLVKKLSIWVTMGIINMNALISPQQDFIEKVKYPFRLVPRVFLLFDI